MRTARSARTEDPGRRPARARGEAGSRLPRGAAPARPARRRSLSLLWMGGLLLAGALFHVWSRLAVVDLGYRLAEARSAHGDLLERNRRLALELATLEAPAKLAESAREKLGLLPPSPAQIVHLGAAAHAQPEASRSASAAGPLAAGRTGAGR